MDSMRRRLGQLGAILLVAALAACQEHRHSSEMGLSQLDQEAMASAVRAQLAAGRWAQADSLLASSGALEARPALLQYWSAQLALRRGDAEAAATALTLAAASTQPAAELALMELAMLQSAQGDHAAAASSCERLLARHAAHPEAVSLRVSSLAELGRFDEARAAVQALPDSTLRWSLIGHVELLSGHPAAALEPLSRYHEADPNAPLANYLYAWALLANGRAADAVSLLRPLQELEPPYKDSTQLLIQALKASGQGEMARRVVAERTARASMRQVAALRERAFELAEVGNLDEALAALREAESLAPEDAALLNDLGAVLTRRREYEAAAAVFQRAAALAPEDAAIAGNWMQLYVLMGEREKAAQQRARYEALREQGQ